MGQGGLDEHEGGSHVHSHGALPVGERHGLDGAFHHHAGIVDENVQAPGARHGLFHSLAGLRGVDEVDGDGLAFFVRATLCGDDARAVFPEPSGDGLANAAAPAGDERHLSCKAAHFTGFPPFTSTIVPHM